MSVIKYSRHSPVITRSHLEIKTDVDHVKADNKLSIKKYARDNQLWGKCT